MAFYELLYGFRPPAHVQKWVAHIFQAHAEGKGYTLNGWRGSWKSVSLSVVFMIWRIGIEPSKTNVVISANDDSSEKITGLAAKIIEFHPAWKRAFPDIVPETGRWTTSGYFVIDTSMPREKWAESQAASIDPTFVGGGFTSTRINGKHPTGCLIVDDIHDLNNSSSEKERKAVTKAMTTVILMTVIRKHDKLDTWFLNVGVPWAEDDCHRILKNSGEFLYDETPAMTAAAEGIPGAIYIDGVNRENGIVYEDIQGWWILTDPVNFGVKSILGTRSLGKSDFWQMIMLNIAMASTGRLAFVSYPSKEIDPTWPTQGGVDPTNVEHSKGDQAKLSNFAIAYVAKLPTGGAVVVDGEFQRCGLKTGVGLIKAAQSRFPNWLGAAIENTGGGSVVIQAIPMIDPSIIVYDSDLTSLTDKKKAGVKSKPERIKELSTWFEIGRIRISDADTEFLNTLRKLFVNFFELIADEKNPAWDVGDAVYHAVKAMPDILQTPTYQNVTKQKVRKNPLAGIGAWHGYEH